MRKSMHNHDEILQKIRTKKDIMGVVEKLLKQ